jgi:hypothetical protein
MRSLGWRNHGSLDKGTSEVGRTTIIPSLVDYLHHCPYLLLFFFLDPSLQHTYFDRLLTVRVYHPPYTQLSGRGTGDRIHKSTCNGRPTQPQTHPTPTYSPPKTLPTIRSMRSSNDDSIIIIINISIRASPSAACMLMLASFCTPESNNNIDNIKTQPVPPALPTITLRSGPSINQQQCHP